MHFQPLPVQTQVCTQTSNQLTDVCTVEIHLNTFHLGLGHVKTHCHKNIKATLKCCYALHDDVGTTFSHDRHLVWEHPPSKDWEKSSEDGMWLPMRWGDKKDHTRNHLTVWRVFSCGKVYHTSSNNLNTQLMTEMIMMMMMFTFNVFWCLIPLIWMLSVLKKGLVGWKR